MVVEEDVRSPGAREVPHPERAPVVDGATSLFVDNGIVGQSDTVSGTDDSPCGGTARPTVGTFFCVAPVSQSAVNAAAGLPGLGRARLPSTVIADP